MKKENKGQRGKGRKTQDHLPMAGSDKVPVTAPQKPLTNECHSLSYPNNKKNWLYWNK